MAKALDEMRYANDSATELREAEEKLRVARAEWEAAVKKATQRVPLRKERFSTLSDVEVPFLALPEHPDADYMNKLGMPGAYPFTRGVQPTAYRGKLWTMRQF